MRILTNVSQAELSSLTSKPTAKEMIKKIETGGIHIAEGDKQGAAEFMAMKNRQRQEDSLHISDEGRTALKKESEAKEASSQEEQLMDRIEELKAQLSKIKAQGGSGRLKNYQENKADAIKQQLSMLSMQLVQVKKTNSESGRI